MYPPGLSETDLAFLDEVRTGATLRAAAERLHYGPDWAKKRSRRIRGVLGVQTMEEALRMTEVNEGVSRQEFDGLRRLIEATNEAVESLARAVTPRQQEQAQQQVQARELDEKEMAKKLGISLDDVARVREENEYAKYKKMEARRQKELEEEQAATQQEPQRDGLGGITNLVKGLGGAGQ